MILRRIFARSVADEARNIRESIERDNLRELRNAAPYLRPAGLGEFERGLARRHVIREEA